MADRLSGLITTTRPSSGLIRLATRARTEFRPLVAVLSNDEAVKYHTLSRRGKNGVDQFRMITGVAARWVNTESLVLASAGLVTADTPRSPLLPFLEQHSEIFPRYFELLASMNFSASAAVVAALFVDAVLVEASRPLEKDEALALWVGQVRQALRSAIDDTDDSGLFGSVYELVSVLTRLRTKNPLIASRFSPGLTQLSRAIDRTFS